MYAKYFATERLSASIDISNPIFIVEGKETTKISEINNIGYYEFSIKNFNKNLTSEIGFLYTIEIISDTDECIQFELYNETSQIALQNLKTESIAIKGNEPIEHKYKLKVVYDKTKGNKGKNILEEVQVKVHSEQEII